MEILAIIPARGGSKSIPRKNVLPMAGKPMLSWTIAAARGAKAVTRVVVSTDDAEIAAIAREARAEVVWRPAEISNDTASSESALLQVLEYLREKESYQPDLVAFLQCTSPLTASEDIDNTVKRLLDQQADSALTGTDFHYFLWKIGGDGAADGINHDKRFRPRRQDREPQYIENGALYVMKTPGFIEHKHRFFGKTVMVKMPPERCFEIDEPVDFKIAEMLLRERKQGAQLDALPERIAALVLDFDGVMTDNAVLLSEDGKETVRCDRGDGMGISRLRAAGVPIIVLSSEHNPVVSKRCEKLKIAYIQQLDDKAATLRRILQERNIDPAATVFVGNDVNDVECLKAAGCGVVVNDAHEQTLNSAKLILNHCGGHGAVREICDLIIKKMGK